MSSIEVIFNGGHLTNVYYVHIAQISSFGIFPGGGGWEEVIIRLISAEAEAKAWLSLAKFQGKSVFEMLRKEGGKYILVMTHLDG